MKKIIAFAVMVIFSAGLVAVATTAEAAAGFQCADCHTAPDQILPAKHIKRNDFAGCFSCHSNGRKVRALSGKIHAVHLTEGKISEQNCLACHPSDAAGNMQTNASGKTSVKKADLPDLAKKMGSWLKSDKLVHAHQKKGVSCQACHTDYGEDDPYNERCISCHGNYDAMIPKTAGTKQARNPHKSHYPTLKCTNCHQSHDSFKDFAKPVTHSISAGQPKAGNRRIRSKQEQPKVKL